MRLIEPVLEFKEEVQLFKKESFLSDHTIHGCGNLDRYTNYEDWLRHLVLMKDINTVLSGKVPSITFIAINNQNEMVGIVNIRTSLTNFLFDAWWKYWL